MFFTPKFEMKTGNGLIFFTAHTALDLPLTPVSGYISETVKGELVERSRRAASSYAERPDEAKDCRKLVFSLGIPGEVRALLAAQGADIVNDQEEYVAVLGEESFVYGTSARGLLFGLSTLLALLAHGENESCILYDYPTCPVRGYRVYLPGRRNIPVFKQMVDFLAYYRYNTIMIEIGGAMEYKRHPEINEQWVKFCADVHRYSGRAREIQFKTYPWEKNSIHCDNGDGEYLTQDECRELAAYCRARGMEVIPECPTYSHSDYMVQAHPELRERMNDEHADTYCPLHPDTYKLVFDVLDEIIDVFAPEQINIGHDELYSVGVCPRCREKDPVDLYIDDVTTIRDYLAGKGIAVMMWGEKLLKAVDAKTGRKYGGWYDEKTRNGATYQIPALYPCAERMPSGVTFLHWYWSFQTELDRVYHDHGYPMVFGNFNALDCEHFRERIEWGARGGFVSNWGSNAPEYMQRNRQYFALIGTAYALWCDDYDYDNREPYIYATFAEAYRRHYENSRNTITVLHTTDTDIPYKYFYDGVFIEDEVYMLGHYRLSYSDGSSVLLPVKYGTNITTCRPGEFCSSQALREVSGSCMPVLCGNHYAYMCQYENPCPEKTIIGMLYEPCPGKEDSHVVLHSVSFGNEDRLPDGMPDNAGETAQIFQ